MLFINSFHNLHIDTIQQVFAFFCNIKLQFWPRRGKKVRACCCLVLIDKTSHFKRSIEISSLVDGWLERRGGEETE